MASQDMEGVTTTPNEEIDSVIGDTSQGEDTHYGLTQDDGTEPNSGAHNSEAIGAAEQHGQTMNHQPTVQEDAPQQDGPQEEKPQKEGPQQNEHQRDEPPQNIHTHNMEPPQNMEPPHHDGEVTMPSPFNHEESITAVTQAQENATGNTSLPETSFEDVPMTDANQPPVDATASDNLSFGFNEPIPADLAATFKNFPFEPDMEFPLNTSSDAVMESFESGTAQVPILPMQMGTNDHEPHLNEQVDDGTSLFFPYQEVSVSSARHNGSSAMPPPNTSSAVPGKKAVSSLTFDKIRAMQKRKVQKPKGPAARPALPRSSLLRPMSNDDFQAEDSTNNPVLMASHKSATDDDNEDRKALENYLRLKKHYDDIKSNGGLSFRQDIEWMKIQSAEEARQKKLKRDRQKMEAEQISFQAPGSSFRVNQWNGFDADEGEGPPQSDMSGARGNSSMRRKQNPPLRQPLRLSMHDAEHQAMMVEMEAHDDRPKSKKRQADDGDSQRSTKQAKSAKSAKTAKPKKPTGKSAASKSKAGATKAKGTRTSAKQKREQELRIAQTASLINGDVFADQAAQDAPDQPTFTSRNKNDAMKELIASVSTENQKAANADVKVLMAATRDFDGFGTCRAEAGLWVVTGMKTALKPYQVLGSAFMRRRERAAEEPRGGLLADQMGLGKTLMMLANIVNGRPAPGENKTTLLIASPALLTQWDREIATHTACDLSVMRYGTGNRLSTNRDQMILKEFDVVLTTYGEILRSYPKNQPPVELLSAEEKLEWWRKQWNEKRGILHKIQWHRIVLDEAQIIKNHQSRTSVACRALMADHKWALSGTPILNSLEELYPYFKFLRVPHTGSFKIFKNNYCDTNNAENAERLLLRLNQFMIRRTHKDIMFGAPILKLPKADQLTLWCEFNAVERNIYDIVQARFIEKINSLVEKNEINKCYSNVLVMLLRLRQLTAHPLMLQFVMRDLLELEDIERIRKVVNEFANDRGMKHTIIAVREQLERLAEEERNRPRGQDPRASQDCFSPESEEGSELPQNLNLGAGRKFGTEFDFKPYLESLTSGASYDKAKENAACCACGNGGNLWITSCHHLYCENCYEDAHVDAASRDIPTITCQKCGTKFSNAQPLHVSVDPQFGGPITRTRSGRAKERYRQEREDLKEDWLSLGGESMLPSAKSIAIKAQILNWIKENPNVKIIVYTQFLPMIRILTKMCRDEGWGAAEYHGKLSFAARDKTIQEFEKNAHMKVLLASLRCGGLGLNLTMASRVIVVDPWWNSAVEQQAFCRVFRIGQLETTFMTKFCVRNTVDERLIRMQQRKQREIDEIMEDDGKRTKQMGLKDLMRLFGSVVEDDEGRPHIKPYILVDDVNPHGGFHADKEHEGYADEE